MIVVNFVVLGTSLAVEGHDEMFEHMHDAILVFFVVETGVRLHRMHWNMRLLLSSRWDTADVIIIGLSCLPLLGIDAALPLSIARMARLVHHARHLSHLRMFRFVVKWGTSPRPWLEIIDVDGKVKPLCFFCATPIRWRDMRLNRHGWVYGPCCNHRKQLYAEGIG
jgi:hypothetical protein